MLNVIESQIVTVYDLISSGDLSDDMNTTLTSLTRILSLNIQSVEKLIKIIKDNKLGESVEMKSRIDEIKNNKDIDSTQYRIKLNELLQFIYACGCPSQAVDDFAESFKKTLAN